MSTNDIDFPIPDNLQTPNGKLKKKGKEKNQIGRGVLTDHSVDPLSFLIILFYDSPHGFNPGDLVLSRMNVN